MAETIIISSKPGIKCYVRNYTITTKKTTVEGFRKLRDIEWLWTGEYPYCICAHHVEQYCTIRDRYGTIVTIHCHGNESCNCELFRTLCIRIDQIGNNSSNKIVTEALAHV